MEESITLKENGKEIKFWSWLTPSGIQVYCSKKQFHCEKEKEAFEKLLKSERDVVGSIKYTDE